MICEKCGVNIPNGAKKCPKCSEPVMTGGTCGGFTDILSYTPPTTSAFNSSANDKNSKELIKKVNLATYISLAAAGLSFVVVILSIIGLSSISNNGEKINKSREAMDTAFTEIKEKDDKKLFDSLSDKIDSLSDDVAAIEAAVADQKKNPEEKANSEKNKETAARINEAKKIIDDIYKEDSENDGYLAMKNVIEYIERGDKEKIDELLKLFSSPEKDESTSESTEENTDSESEDKSDNKPSYDVESYEVSADNIEIKKAVIEKGNPLEDCKITFVTEKGEKLSGALNGKVEYDDKEKNGTVTGEFTVPETKAVYAFSGTINKAEKEDTYAFKGKLTEKNDK